MEWMTIMDVCTSEMFSFLLFNIITLDTYSEGKSRNVNVGSIVYSTTGIHLPDKIVGSVKEQFRKDGANNKVTFKEKSDRATVEQVMDPRTRLILLKMINNGTIKEINGCISTGKEANVYHATTNEGDDLALKIYKTSILVFKDRDRYVSGEFRFRRGYSRHNPRKMVQVWAEKEMRNLLRIKNSGIPCPHPVLLRKHIFMMTFIGKKGKAAPRLKDANLTFEQLSDCYWEIAAMMRTLYQECKLVHADLSEYNLLYFKKKVYVIDVSQSVEHDHPSSLEFLRRDCVNVNQYFLRQGVKTATNRELFDFITDITLEKDKVDDYIQALINKIEERGNLTHEEEIAEQVFLNSYIPRTLDEISPDDAEDHRWDAMWTRESDVYYRKLAGLNEKLTGPAESPDLLRQKKKRIKDPLLELYKQQLIEFEAKGGFEESDEEDGEFDEEEGEFDEEDGEFEEYDEDEEDEEYEEGDEEDDEEDSEYDEEYEEDGEYEEYEIDEETYKQQCKYEKERQREMNRCIKLLLEEQEEEEWEEEEEDEEEEDEEDEEDGDENVKERTNNRRIKKAVRVRKRLEDKDSKKERKKEAKDQKSERRKTKVPKYIKKKSRKPIKKK